jgi:LmbE family N-acetylglucosaminyl deacetylase
VPVTTRTLVAVHAHPDDEVISTGGILARYADEGVRTVVITCTDGSQGFGPGGVLPGEPGHDRDAVAETRRAELERSCSILGVAHLEVLGYRDSGMMGWAANSESDAFMNVGVEHAAAAVAGLLARYEPQIVVTYDDNGGYGHPDHIQTHRVVMAALEQSGAVSKLYFTARSESHARRMLELRQRLQVDVRPGRPRRATPMGIPESMITTVVETRPVLDRKRAALHAHASQLADTVWVKVPDEDFADLFGQETFVRALDRTGAPLPETDLYDGL